MARWWLVLFNLDAGTAQWSQMIAWSTGRMG